jgi:hypothetical protein
LKTRQKVEPVKRHDRKASLWAENCPNFLAGRKKLQFFWEIYPTLGYFNYGPTFTEVFSPSGRASLKRSLLWEKYLSIIIDLS